MCEKKIYEIFHRKIADTAEKTTTVTAVAYVYTYIYVDLKKIVSNIYLKYLSYVRHTGNIQRTHTYAEND